MRYRIFSVTILIFVITTCSAQIVNVKPYTIKFCTFQSFTDNNRDCVTVEAIAIRDGRRLLFSYALGGDWTKATSGNFLALIDDKGRKRAIGLTATNFISASDNSFTTNVEHSDILSFVGVDKKIHTITFGEFIRFAP